MNATMTEVVDDGRRPDRLGRVRTPRSRREELPAEHERSGLSQAAFARRAGVRYPTFAHRVQERRSAGGDNGVVAPSAADPPTGSGVGVERDAAGRRGVARRGAVGLGGVGAGLAEGVMRWGRP